MSICAKCYYLVTLQRKNLFLNNKQEVDMNRVGIQIDTIDNSRQGLKSVQNSVTSFARQVEQYTTIAPKIDSRAFDQNLKSLIGKLNTIGTLTDKIDKKGAIVGQTMSGKYTGDSLTAGSGKKKIEYNLADTFVDANALKKASADIAKSLAEGRYSETLTQKQIKAGRTMSDAEIARRYVADAEELLKYWKLVNKEAEAYIAKPAKDADKRRKNLETAFNSAESSKAVKAMKEREKAQRKLNELEERYAVERQKVGTYNTNLYPDVRKKLTAEQEMIKILNEQARLYALIGEKSKSASAKGRATRMQTQAEETSARLINWTGNDKGLIASYDTSNIKKQLNAISRDITNTYGRESVLQTKVEVPGWEGSVQRFRDAIKAAEKSFTIGKDKFKITGLDSAVVALEKIDKLAAKGIKGAAAWQQKLNEYLAAHVDVANKYQTHQNQILESQKRFSKTTENYSEKRQDIENQVTHLEGLRQNKADIKDDIQQLNAEKGVVGQLISAYRQLASAAKKANDKDTVTAAEKKIENLRKEYRELDLLAIAARNYRQEQADVDKANRDSEKRQDIENKIKNAEQKVVSTKGITDRVAQINAERAAIGTLIPLYEQLIRFDEKRGVDTSANRDTLQYLRERHTELKNIANAEREAQKAASDAAKARNAMSKISKNIVDLNTQRKDIAAINDKRKRLVQEYNVVKKLRGAWEAYLEKAKASGSNVNISKIEQRIAALRREEQQLYRNRIAEENQVNNDKEVAELEKKYAGQGTLLGKLTRLASRYFSIHTIVEFGKKIADVTGKMQQQQVALEGIVGSASKAKSILNDIYDFALQSPFQTGELIQYTKQLSAYGIDPDELFPRVKELADISVGLGVDMDRLILAYGQVKSASVLRGQELRQFTEAGIPMVQALADKFTALNGELVTTADIFDMISKRQVSFDVVSEVLSDMTKEGGKFYKMQENITDTLYGQIQKLKDLWFLSLKDIGKSTSGIFNGIVKLLQNVVTNAKSIVVALGAAFTGSAIYRFIASLGTIETKMKAYIRLLKISSKVRNLAFGGLIGAGIGVAVGLIAKVTEEARKLKKAFDEIEESFNRENIKMIEGLDSLAKKIQTSKIGTKEFSDAVGTLVQNYGDFISDDILKALQGQGDAAHQTAMAFGEIAENVKLAIKEYNKYKEIQEKKDTVKSNLYNDKIWISASQNLRSYGPMYNEIRKYLKESYGYDVSFSDTNEVLKNIFKDAVDEFAIAGKEFSREEFAQIYRETLKREIPTLSEVQQNYIINSGWNAINTNITGKQALQALRNLSREEQRSDYYTQRKYFDAVNTSKDAVYVEKDRIATEDNKEAVYIKALEQTLSNARDEIKVNIPDELWTLLKGAYAEDEEGRIYATDNFNNKTIFNISKILEELESVLDGDMKNWVAGVNKLFDDATDAKTKRAADVSELIENNSAYRNHEIESIRSFWESFRPSNENYDSKREDVASKYSELKKELESYSSRTDKDEEYIKSLETRIAALKVLASKDYFNIKLDDTTGGSNSETLPAEIADLINEMKTAYTRYKEATQKGGVELGLDYVRTNEYFQKTFGAFFGGAQSSAFAEIAKLKIGTTTAGDLLKDKFLSGTEDGIINFQEGLKSLRDELEKYGNADKKNRKAYINAAKALDAWIDNTFSKDNLNAVLLELSNELKVLTNSFEKTNKAVDLYRKLQEKGTLSELGAEIGITRDQALQPESDRIREHVMSYIAAYNAKLPETAIGFDVGTLDSVNGVYTALDKLEKVTELNKAFGVDGIGEQVGKEAQNLLKQLLETLIREASSISGEVYSGDVMKDLAANVSKRFDSRMFALTQQENVARNNNTYDWEAIKSIVTATKEDASAIFEQFMKDNRLDVLARENSGVIDEKVLDGLQDRLESISKDFPSALRDELLNKLTELRNKVSEYNASAGTFGAFGGAIRDYRDADERAKEMYDKEKNRNSTLFAMLTNAKAVGDQEEVDRINISLALSNERLKAMGENGKILAEEFRDMALDNLQKSISACQEKFQSMVGVVNSVIDATKAFSQTINKVYDVLNDGENPEWMQDMDGFINDFGESFEAMVTPMISVISLFATLTTAIVACEAAATPLLIALAVVIAVAAVVAGIIAAVQSHDRKLQRTIEDLEKQIDDTRNAITNVNAAAERLVGLEKQEAQLKSLSMAYEIYIDKMKQAKAEQAKHNTDEDELKKYLQEAQEALDEFLTGLFDWREEILFSVTDMAGSIADAMRSAFQSGGNAAREMAATVKQSIGDMIMNMIQLTYLEPAIQGVMEEFFGGDANELKDRFMTTQADGKHKYDYKKALNYFAGLVTNGEAMENLEDELGVISSGLIDFTEGLGEKIGEYLSFNGDTSSLSGGISGITEDTARQLEGLNNSMLMQLVMINQGIMNLSESAFANVQTSWLNDMLANTRAIQSATSEMNQAIKDMRNGVRPLYVEMK